MDDHFRSRRLDRFGCQPWSARHVCSRGLFLIWSLFAGVCALAAPQLEISPLGYRIEQLTPVAGMTRTYDLTARAGVTNTRDGARGVMAQLNGGNAGVVVLDGQLSFGDVDRTAALRPVISLDTFKLRFVLPRTLSPLALLQYFQSALNSLSWAVNCANCGTNRPPVAHAGAAQTVYLGQTVTLDGSASSDPDGQTLAFRWSVVSLPEGSHAALSDAVAVRTSFVVDKEGVYVFRLVVSDEVADSAPVTTTVVTRNSAPVADAGPDRTVRVGDKVQLDGSNSTDIDGDALTYEWNLLDHPEHSMTQLADADPASPLAAFRVDKPGRYIAQLIVNDARQESAPDTAVISTINSPPVADAGPDRTGRVHTQVELNASGSSDADGDNLSYRWSLTVPLGSQASLTTTMGATTSFVIDKPGEYVAQLVVGDGVTDSAADTVVVSTTNSAPVADAGSGMTVNVGEWVILDGGRSSDADADPLSFAWSLISVPPGSLTTISASQSLQPSFLPDRAGLYVAQLVVNDGIVNSAPVTVNVTARDLLPPSLPDVQPPPIVDVSLIGITQLSSDQLQLAGATGSVEGQATLKISNFATGETFITTANSDGSFRASVRGSSDDALIVVVSDTAGNQSDAVNVGALNPIQLTVQTPVQNQALPGSAVLVTGTLRAPLNTGVVINGKPAAVHFNPGESTYELQLELAPPVDGSAEAAAVPIEVMARTADGRTIVRSVTVQVHTFDLYTLHASRADGPVSMEVEFDITDNLGEGIASVSWDFDGDGDAEVIADSPLDTIAWRYTQPGSYNAVAKIVSPSGTVHAVRTPVHVYERILLAEQLRKLWSAFVTALSSENLPLAQLRLNESAQERYGPVLHSLSSQLPQIMTGSSLPELTDAGSDIAELLVTRQANEELQAFFIYLTRDSDGVWRVAAM